MKKLFYLSAIVAGFTFQACNNQQSSNDSVDSAEAINDSTLAHSGDHSSDFLIETASGGLMEVELGKLAQSNASSQRVKNFASMMVTDHTKANNELMALAQSKNITLPATMGEDHQEMMNDLKGKTGAEFDKAYMEMMVEDHKEDIENFEEASEDTKDADVSAFASKTLPVLKMHADSAKAIHEAVKK